MEPDFFIVQTTQIPMLFRQFHQMLPSGSFRVRLTTLSSDGMFLHHDHVYTPKEYLDKPTREAGIAAQSEEILKVLRSNLRPENLPALIAKHKEQAKKMREAQEAATPPDAESQNTVENT